MCLMSIAIPLVQRTAVCEELRGIDCTYSIQLWKCTQAAGLISACVLAGSYSNSRSAGQILLSAVRSNSMLKIVGAVLQSLLLGYNKAVQRTCTPTKTSKCGLHS